MEWIALKLDLATSTGLDRDALHIYAAVIVQMLVAVVTRRSLGDAIPWLIVAGVSIANEWADLRYETWPDRSLQHAGAIHDLVNTIMLPTVLLLGVRFLPRLFTRLGPID